MTETKKKRKVSEKSLANLKPSPFTPENARERQKKGVEAYWRNKEKREAEKARLGNMKQELLLLLSLAIKKGVPADSDEFLSLEEVQDKNISVQTAINVAMIQRALMGDVQAAQYIRDTTGQKPTDKVEIDESLTIEAWAKSHDVQL